MSSWEDFLSSENFRLAWERVLWSRHHSTKDQLGLQVFASNIDANIQHVKKRIESDLYEPRQCHKAYMPKRVGTLRSQPFLTIADRLVYQAIVNVVARKSKVEFEAVTAGHVYAHLAADLDGPFMLKQWAGPNGQYRRFIRQYTRLWQCGNRWVAEADIASFYDSIDHEMLGEQLMKRWIDSPQLVSLLKSCLRAWSSHEGGVCYSRGLPQGYEGSDYLATVFLMPVDQAMIHHGFSCVRYVDDFRVLARSQDDARRGLIRLDLQLKACALVLQPDKTGVREVGGLSEVVDEMASRLSMLDLTRRVGGDISAEADSLLVDAAKRFGQDKHAESHMVFALHRASRSRESKSVALMMLSELPWRSDTVNWYLSEFSGDMEVINTLKDEVRLHTLYGWHLAHCIRALSRVAGTRTYGDICRKWIMSSDLPWIQRLAAVDSLAADSESYSFLVNCLEREDNYLLRRGLLVASVRSARTQDQIGFAIRIGLSDPDDEVVSTAVWLYLDFPDCGIALHEFVGRVGIHRSMIPWLERDGGADVCYISAKLRSLFDVSIPEGLCLRDVLAVEYDEAVVHLGRAVRYLKTDPTIFVSSLDNFNHILAIKLSEDFDKKQIPCDKFGNIVDALAHSHPIVSAHFKACHDLRSSCRGAHPWASKYGRWAQDVSYGQRDRLVNGMKIAYQAVLDAFSSRP